MKPDETTVRRQVTQAWVLAAQELGIEVIAPYTLRLEGHCADCVAFLPSFGGPLGIVIGIAAPPDFETDTNLIKCANAIGLFYSFLNPEAYTTYDEDRFKDALKDWRFFGPPERRPRWFVE